MPAAVRIFVVFLLAYFLSYFFRAANAVIAPDLSRDLNLNPSQLGFMTSVFYLTFALVQIPLGSLLDRYGPRFVHPALMLLGAAGALVFALAPNFAVLTLGRAMLGVGMGAALMGTLKAFSLWFSPARYASVSSLFVGLGATGALAAATPLAWLSESLGWRGVFMWGALVIVVVAATVAIFVRNAPPGVALPQSSGGGDWKKLWTNPHLWRTGWLNFTLGGGFLAWQTLWGGAYLYQVKGLTALEVGNLLFLFSLGALVGFLFCGPLADRWGLPKVFLGAGVVMTVAVLLLATLNLPAAWLAVVYPIMGLAGGFNILSLVQARLLAPPELTGRAVTLVNFMGFFGVFCLQWLMGLVVQAAGYPLGLALWGGLLLSAVVGYSSFLRQRVP